MVSAYSIVELRIENNAAKANEHVKGDTDMCPIEVPDTSEFYFKENGGTEYHLYFPPRDAYRVVSIVSRKNGNERLFFTSNDSYPWVVNNMQPEHGLLDIYTTYNYTDEFRYAELVFTQNETGKTIKLSIEQPPFMHAFINLDYSYYEGNPNLQLKLSVTGHDGWRLYTDMPITVNVEFLYTDYNSTYQESVPFMIEAGESKIEDVVVLDNMFHLISARITSIDPEFGHEYRYFIRT